MSIKPMSLLVLVLFAATSVSGQQPEAERNWTEAVAESVNRFKIFADDRSAEPAEVIQAYQWANTARPVRGERLCLLYVDKGRPIASCKIYPTGRSIVHAFVAMTDRPIVCRQGDSVVWAPSSEGLRFAKVPGAAPPHPSATRRRIEMKAVAREFSAETGPGEAQRQKAVPELRLLPTPLHRYSHNGEGNGDDGIIDGAVFCFVVGGGNPQIFLLLEAIREDGQTYWQYAFSRRTIAQLRAFHRAQEVWSVESVGRGDLQSTGDFHKISLPVTDDEEDEDEREARTFPKGSEGA